MLSSFGYQLGYLLQLLNPLAEICNPLYNGTTTWYRVPSPTTGYNTLDQITKHIAMVIRLFFITLWKIFISERLDVDFRLKFIHDYNLPDKLIQRRLNHV